METTEPLMGFEVRSDMHPPVTGHTMSANTCTRCIYVPRYQIINTTKTILFFST